MFCVNCDSRKKNDVNFCASCGSSNVEIETSSNIEKGTADNRKNRVVTSSKFQKLLDVLAVLSLVVWFPFYISLMD